MNLCIVDFGSASIGDDNNLTMRVGTPGYMAPEVLRRGGYKGTRADVYSLAVTLFVIVVGVLPHDTNWIDHLKNGTTDDYFKKFDKKGKISPEFKEIIISMYA